jgi:hypothetical protein
MTFLALIVAVWAAGCDQTRSPIKEWQPGNRLTWGDFAAAPPDDARHDAETATGITQSRWTCDRGWLAVVGARAYFNRTASFVLADKADDELLQHEQGHFDLTELYARQLRERIRAIRCANLEPAAMQAAVDVAVRDVDLGFMAESERYDRETEHGRDRASQQEWNQHLRERLDRTAGH